MIGEKNTILDRSGLTLSDAAEIETRLFQNKEGLLRAELLIEDPIAMEAKINQIVGVVTNGLFASRPANILLLGTSDGVKTYSKD